MPPHIFSLVICAASFIAFATTTRLVCVERRNCCSECVTASRSSRQPLIDRYGSSECQRATTPIDTHGRAGETGTINHVDFARSVHRLSPMRQLTLRTEIDHNFSRAHRIVTSSILPIVEQYASHSKEVWEGSKVLEAVLRVQRKCVPLGL